jgi:hypothetical protein
MTLKAAETVSCSAAKIRAPSEHGTQNASRFIIVSAMLVGVFGMLS